METNMEKVLSGKVAIVTGAGRGIGRGIAVELAAEGAKVIVASRGQSSIERTVHEICAAGNEAHGIQCDVADPDAIRNTVAETVERYGRLDILVNNAQAYGPPGKTPLGRMPTEDVDIAAWQYLFDTGPTASLRFMQAAFPFLKESGAGRVINFGSYYGQIGFAETAAYNSAKEAIRGLSRTAAREWGKHNITVNVINPALRSDSLDSFIRNRPEEAAVVLEQIPLQRYGDIFKDGGRVAVFLAGPDSSYLTGMTFQLDGGLFMHP